LHGAIIHKNKWRVISLYQNASKIDLSKNMNIEEVDNNKLDL